MIKFGWTTVTDPRTDCAVCGHKPVQVRRALRIWIDGRPRLHLTWIWRCPKCKADGVATLTPPRDVPDCRPPKWCWRAAVAENSCACQDGCQIPPHERVRA